MTSPGANFSFLYAEINFTFGTHLKTQAMSVICYSWTVPEDFNLYVTYISNYI